MRDAAVLSTVLSSPQDAVPESFHTAWYARGAVRVHRYPDGALAVFHGPRCLARYNAAGEAIAAVPPA
jgi:hypothetical protein